MKYFFEILLKVLIRDLSISLLPDLPSHYPGTYLSPLPVSIEELSVRLLPNGSVQILKSGLNGVQSQSAPRAPPRPSMQRTATTQTINVEDNHFDSQDALLELQVKKVYENIN